MTITVTQAVTELTVNIEQSGTTVQIQPTVTVNPTSDLYMLKSVYDPANQEEQVLTISSVVDGGEIT